MNEELSHLTPVGDEALEARIIAWVLGQSSSFEAAELEKICEQAPEWRVFQRRMLAIHQLLGEATSISQSDDWSLPSEKRGKLDEILGVEKAVVAPLRKRSKWWGSAARIAAVVVVVLTLGSLATTGVWPKKMNREMAANRGEVVANSMPADTKSIETPEESLFSKTPATAVDENVLPDLSDDEKGIRSSDDSIASATADPFASAFESVVFSDSDSLTKPELAPPALTGMMAAGRPGAPASRAMDGFAAGETSLAQREGVRRGAAVEFNGRLDQGLGDGQDSARDRSASGGGSGSGGGGGFSAAEEALMRSEAGALVLGNEGEKAKEENKGEITNDFTSPADYQPPVIGRLFKQNASASSATEHEPPVEKNELLARDNGKSLRKAIAMEAGKKIPSLVELAEISAEQESYSTFSLRVSDNSFRVAQAAMARNQRPAAESVRVEEFYNAFDYGDPMPTANEPVAAAMEQAAHPILPQRNLLRIGLRTAAAGRGAGQPLHLTLLVDRSGSMSRGDRSDALAAAVKELTSLLTAQDQISVIGFSRTPRLLAEKLAGNQTESIIQLLARTPSDGGTNLEEALKLGELVAKRNHLAGAQNRLLLMTDGAANLGNADPQRLAAWVKSLRQQDIAFDIAGIGTDGLNDPLLVEISRNGNGRYYVMNDAKQAKQEFAAQLAGAFRPAAENVKVQVQFNPQRVGKYKLIGFEKDRLRTEDFRNDKIDAAELAAAEAGQALYQIELLPEGVGDVGEVSVRFRDVATQQMIERKWTIRYDPSTPAFDRASPTMQLAGLAMLTAEKLQGRDAASQIRFPELQESQQRVRREFSSNKRVGELLEMIQQLN